MRFLSIEKINRIKKEIADTHSGYFGAKLFGYSKLTPQSFLVGTTISVGWDSIFGESFERHAFDILRGRDVSASRNVDRP